MSEQSLNDMPSLSLDDIEDAPGFDTPPSGKYLCAMSLTSKHIKDKPYISVDFELKEVVAFGDQTEYKDRPALPGQKFNVLYQFSDQGLKYLKPHLIMARTALGCGADVAEIIASTKDLMVEATFKYRKSPAKDGSTNSDGTPKVYDNFQISSMKVI